MRTHLNCPTCSCDTEYEEYDGWRDLQSHYPGVTTVDQLRVAVREEYKREHPRKWARCTSDEAVESAVKAYEPYIRGRRPTIDLPVTR